MLHKLLGVLFAGALLVSPSFAQDDKDKYGDKDKDKSKTSTETTTDTKRTTSSGTTHMKSEVLMGEVKSYEPGKSIEVTTPGKLKKSRTFDLNDKDVTATVDPGVAVGSHVKITMKTDNNGHKTLMVEPHGKGKKEHAAAHGEHHKEKQQ